MSRKEVFGQYSKVLRCATQASRAAGRLMRQHRLEEKEVREASRYDIRLALDIRCQKVIERILRRAFANIPILGEEGVVGDQRAAQRWVVDPIDGTVNFTYGIPHCCVSIALQQLAASPGPATYEDGNETLLGEIGRAHV